MKKRAIISLTDKTGAPEFAKALEELGYEIISTGGTARVLAESGVKVINISDVTGFPECLDGRVKTLHPAIHAGILARRDLPEHMKTLEDLGINTIDIVAINLYPFKKTILKEGTTLEEAIENIDIGGPTMLRAAAKNYGDVAVIVDPADYDTVIGELRNGGVTKETKLKLCYKVFRHTAAYDALIYTYLGKQCGGEMFPDELTLTYEKKQEMRYGENPHQAAAFYKEISNERTGTIAAAVQLHGKELSYNNINDANGALDLVKEFDVPCAVAVKHAVPCGVGIADESAGETIYDAYMKAYNADPVSIFGGIVALNRNVTKACAEELAKIFLEIVIAPSYDDDALAVLEQKKNIRILLLPDITKKNTKDMLDMKKVAGGLLVQQLDTELLGDEIKCVTDRKPTDEEMKAMLFGWKVVKHTKSNAIVLSKTDRTTGVGPGQTNRITALELAVKYAGENAKGSVVASDAFFPFDDCVKAAAKAGVTAIIQPGGSVRDEDSIKACNEAGIAMVFTGMRHFKH